MANVTVRMTSNLFKAARHYNIVLPAEGETVELPEIGAESLIDSGHAELAEDSEVEAEKPEPNSEPVAPKPEQPERRGPGRPPKQRG